MKVDPEVVSSLWLVFAGGLIGSVHCLGMCGPLLALAESVREGKWKVWSQLPLHLGRLITYLLMGLLAGLAGVALERGGMAGGLQGVASFVGGIFMILFAFVLFGWLPIAKKLTSSDGFAGRFARLMASRRPLSGLILGLYWGLLPCGLVWAWLGASTGTGSPLGGALVMFVFGLGTVPALLVIGGIGGLLSTRSRAWLNRLGGITVLLMGVILLLRGAAAAGWIGKVMLAPGVPLY
jgi:sulfite exporter TauE/SafE